MTDLLTKEERETVERAKKNNISAMLNPRRGYLPQAEQDRIALLAIIDNLSKRGVKKYSEDELRAAFEAQPVETVFPERNQEHIIGKVALHAWIECARFLGCQTGQVAMAKSMTYKGWKVTVLGERHKRKDLQCKIFMFHKTGEFIREFSSVHECGRYFGLKSPKSIIRAVDNGKYKQFKLRRQKDNPDTFDLDDYN